MRYLALDQSLNISGWSLFENNKLIDYGTFRINASLTIEQRLGQLWKHLNELNEKYNFSFIFFEDIQYQNNKDTFKKLAYVQSAILLWCYWNDIKYNILAPSHWRKIISENYNIKFGKARADQKKNCLNFIKEHFNLKEVSEDEADSIALGLAGLFERKESAW